MRILANVELIGSLDLQNNTSFPVGADEGTVILYNWKFYVLTDTGWEPAYATTGSGWAYIGDIDCSTDPDYPAAVAGEVYRVSVDGLIGGAANGVAVEAGDMLVCLVDTATGDQPTVGANWNILQGNVVDGLTSEDIGVTVQPFYPLLESIGENGNVENGIAVGNGASGISVVTLDGDTTLAADSDTVIATQRAVKTYVDTALAALDAITFKGDFPVAADPNYPSGTLGDFYRLTGDGKVGGASGVTVTTGDTMLCMNTTVGGDQVTVGMNWVIIQGKIEAYLVPTDIGTTIQPFSPVLEGFQAVSGLNKIHVGTGDDTFDLLDFDTDPLLAADSDTVIASQKAVKAYVDSTIGGGTAVTYQGDTDCSTNPDYPAASEGAMYRVTVAGRIGGASGPQVQVGDVFICLADSASGDQATVGVNWLILQGNIVSALTSADIGSTVQAYDATLNAMAGVTVAANQLIYANGADTFTVTALTAAGRTLIGAADAAAQRTALGLVIGTNVQAQDATLQALAGVTVAADQLIYSTGADTFTTTGFTAAGRTLAAAADATAQRVALGLVIGTNVQAYDVDTAKLDVKQTWTAQQTPKNGTLTDAATIAWDGDTNGQVVSVTLTAARTMGAPTNIVQNAGYQLLLTSGGFTPAWNAAFKWPAGGIPTALVAGTYCFTFVGGAGNTLIPTGPGYLTGV